jgi:transcriptional regulator with XRE-family HTH domain
LSFGEKIKDFCDKNFNSVIDFSEATGINRNTIYQYFKNEVSPGKPFLKKLYDMGCDLNWLFSDDDQPLKIAEPLVRYKSELDECRAENKELKSKIQKMEAILKA